MLKKYFDISIVACANCKNLITYAAGNTNLKVCNSCGVVNERSEGGFTQLSQLSASTDGWTTSLQLGSKGAWKGRKFEVIGALLCTYDDFFCVRYTISWNDSNITDVLIETTGTWAIATPAAGFINSQFPVINRTEVAGESIPLATGQSFHVAARSICKKVAVRGEVATYVSFKGFTSTGLVGHLHRLELIVSTPDFFDLLELHDVPFTDFQFTQLSPNHPEPWHLNCNKCQAALEIRYPKQSTHAACGKCGSWYEITDQQILLASSTTLQPITAPLMPGQKGTLQHVSYEVLGVCEKHEPGEADYAWREYTLYSKEAGYAFLSEYAGNWILLKEVKLNLPWNPTAESICFNNEVYELYNQYNFKVKSATGEFITSLQTAKLNACEYINAPVMYVAEKQSGKSFNWYRGQHVKGDEVGIAFNVPPELMPDKTEKGVLELKWFEMDTILARNIFFAFVSIFLLIQILLATTAREEVVFSSSYEVADSMLNHAIITPSFELKPRLSNLEFKIGSGVSNSWFEANVSLINDQTGAETGFDKGVEYYYGYEGGESWSEGSISDTEPLSSVPRGKYHLVIFPAADVTVWNNKSFFIEVVDDVPMFRNFIFMVLLLAIYPVFNFFYVRSKNYKDWHVNE